jgi:NTE family protein
MQTPKRINVALQGGGAHGAFTWGALERLLEDERIEIAGISGTSAGALNGAAVKSGLAQQGPRQALDNLDWLWEQIGAREDADLPAWLFPNGAAGIAKMMELSPAFQVGDAVSRMTSPYWSGPFYENPLRRITERFNFDKVCCDTGPDFYVSATRVRDGKLRVFEQAEVTPEVIMASACLPTLFRALEIFDKKTGRTEAFWDGGYTGNPALFPLFAEHLPDDIVIININPLERDEVPTTPQAIQNRLNEISFNASMMKELRAIHFVQRLLAEGKLQAGEMARVNIHMIADDSLMTDLSVATKLVPNPFVLKDLHDAGYAAAHKFLKHHFDDLNERASVQLDEMF